MCFGNCENELKKEKISKNNLIMKLVRNKRYFCKINGVNMIGNSIIVNLQTK